MPERWIYRILHKKKSTKGRPLVFTCQQCGECCSSMGEIIEIRDELDPASFRIGFSATGEERIVSLDSEKQELFRNYDIRTTRPMACPFLRENASKKFVCSVHRSRPQLCYQYSCYRILVLDSTGNRIGRVTDGSRYFTTDDAALRKVWNRDIAGLVIPDEGDWEEHVEEVLTHAGYRILR
ncbi:MAG: YkgJ family cysteine cluster protein [Methanoregula sp.]|nr:YkgJ family cysteine cluster protein [Methanoregula sp.]